ncbi:hypothetical protein CYJ89_05645 [Lactobacillus jensenii]|jgi:hypothetical protein|uniref:ParM/StbA family protein n=1 Tax=Lactobacillus jensenii TaxID=109790 RepID=UPI00065E8837|nr:ParM/StbA family protein [Lactobacillus jensenii]MCF1828032.1 ParM/StbA family protein [Lactobacillus jensenii]MDK7295399.1 ParM/StbA family protein [Lactobacillus jensenii]MDK7310202.1 ParM/StbA family protein [Lactobacillus jensenii]MDK7324520.1 ParM/StbA family protein [Lactobacillus jensenii]MDK8130519.1 ParM/StbA family protein [Lactobacillus jensenii]
MAEMNTLVVGNDLGYGDLKISIDNEITTQPTVISPIEQDFENPIDHTDQDAVKNTIDNLLNLMNIEIDGKHYLVGNAAQNSTIERITTDTNSRIGKAHMPAAKIVPLSTIAAKVVQNAYENGEDIFSPLKASVVMTTNLPIDEIENEPSVRDFYKGMFLNNNHIVVFRNFDYKISVTINFKAVDVFKEGEVAAVVAINNATNDLKKYITDYTHKKYPTIEVSRLLGNNKTILVIDIGFKTTELALIVNGEADAFNSSSIKYGYGHVLSSAWKYLPKASSGGYTVKDVVAFKKLLNSKPFTKMEKENRDFALKSEQSATPKLIRKIVSGLNGILGAADNLDAVYVVGGGSIPLMERTDLEQQIKVTLENHRSSATTIWLGEKYAAYANLIGLKAIATSRNESINNK